MMISTGEIKKDYQSLKGADYRDIYAEEGIHRVVKDIKGKVSHFYHKEAGKALRWISGESEFLRAQSLPVQEEAGDDLFLEEIVRRLRDRGVEGDITVSASVKKSLVFNGENLFKKREEIYILKAREKGIMQTSIFTSRPGDVFLDGFVSELQEKQRARKASRPVPKEGEVFLLFTESAASFFVHEILWHPLELDLVLKGESFLDLSSLGDMVFPEEISLSSSSPFPDDEGNPPGNFSLIEEGRLVNFASSVFYSLLSKMPLVPHGRRERYFHHPEVRPQKTFIHRGKLSQLELLRKINRGILIREVEKAWVDFARSRAIFKINLGYWIEQGEITFPIPHARVWVDLPIREIWLSTELNREEHFFCIKEGQKVVFSSLSPDFLIKGYVKND